MQTSHTHTHTHTQLGL